MKKIRIALAGNANVGKSVIFNQLTGLHQHIGNWPGKTVDKAEGTLHYKGFEIDVIDLPGIYSLSTYSLEEVITREYITREKPDVVVNVVDASVLERNLYFTLQLMELGRPMVMALNHVDTAKSQGIEVSPAKLGRRLGFPVVATVAVRGAGLTDLLESVVRQAERGRPARHATYGREIEDAIGRVEEKIPRDEEAYPRRWLAIKLLEGDAEVRKLPLDESVLGEASVAAKGIEHLHDHSCPTAVACEIYGNAATIASAVQKRAERKRSLKERFDAASTGRTGYLIMAAVLLAVFFSVFSAGNVVAGYIEAAFSVVLSGAGGIFQGMAGEVLLGLVEGVIATLTVVVPYILPFYFIMGVLESSGYMARIAFLMDSLMHRIGLHGKAFIPLMLGFGCNVPACLSCRVMETHRERLIAVFVVTLIPCAAVTTVVLGLVGRFVGIGWALALYVIDAGIVLLLGRVAFKALPGEPSGLIMEMPSLRVPHMRTILRQTWFKMEGFVKIAFPVIVASTVVIKLLDVLGVIGVISDVMSPMTVLWLGLPAMAGVLLIFGILRKELTLVMLAALAGTTNFALVMTPAQMLVFALVTMLYIPCASTIAALVKETGLRKALFITVFEVLFAVLVGGLFYRLLLLLGI